MSPVTTLSLGRIAAGLGAYVDPKLAGKVFGLDAVTSPQAPYVARLFAVREVALGAVTLLATGRARRPVLMIGIAVDLADTATAVLGVRDRTVPPRGGAMLIVPAVAAVVAGAAGLRKR